MNARLRMILPPIGAVIGFMVLYAAIEGPIVYYLWKAGGNRLDIPVRPGKLLVRIAAFFYGGHRVLGFHPFYRPGYWAWLELTPWNSRRPLPLGPVAIALEDSLILGLLTACAATQPNLHPAQVVVLALFGYLIALIPTFWPTGEQAFGYASLFGLGLVVRLWLSPWACLAAGVGVAVVSQVGLARSMAQFPWPGASWFREFGFAIFQRGYSNARETQRVHACGWPYDQLRGGNSGQVHVDRRDAVLVGILAGWWLFALEGLSRDIRALTPVLIFLLLTLPPAMAAIRLSMYIGSSSSGTLYWPPISLWGRIRTFRWIIPGYDQVCVAPVCTILTAIGIAILMFSVGIEADVFVPVALAGATMVVLGGGPSIQRWQLTGMHRIQHSAKGIRGAQFVQVN